jgi:hypothetical protein
MVFSRSILAATLLAVLALAGVPLARASSPAPCSWAGESDQRDVNVGAPDLDAYYWLSPITATASTKVLITGEYPRARYFSLAAYDDSGQPLDSVYDQQIAPDRGSGNPFRGAVPRNGAERYHVQLLFEPKPSHPAANTLYAGAPSGAASVVLLELRVYVPADPSQPSGSVPFPQITVQSTAGTPLLEDAACSTTPPTFGAPFWELYAQADSPPDASTTASTAGRPSWSRAFGSTFGNPQNAYLVTNVTHQGGQLLVIRTRAPSFPNTGAGQRVYGRYQLRYWSFCTYDSTGQAVIGCAADYRAAIRSGWITYVVSDPADRPANATAANGVTWLPWGPSSAIQVVYRNMLPAPWFRYAAERITAPNQSAQALMGPYYPTASYCSTATFEHGGPNACLPIPSAHPKAKAKAKKAKPKHKRHRRHTRHKRRHSPHRHALR